MSNYYSRNENSLCACWLNLWNWPRNYHKVTPSLGHLKVRNQWHDDLHITISILAFCLHASHKFPYSSILSLIQWLYSLLEHFIAQTRKNKKKKRILTRTYPKTSPKLTCVTGKQPLPIMNFNTLLAFKFHWNKNLIRQIDLPSKTLCPQAILWMM